MVPKLQKRLFLLCGGFWSSCSLPKVQRRPDRAKCRARTEIFSHKCSSVGRERCPIALFKQCVERRPLNIDALNIKRNRRLNDYIWLKTQPMGVNNISNMMKTTVASTSLEESHKKFTNHSARKTTVSKLKKENVERSDIVKVTSHRSVQSLDDYDEDDEEEQRRLSSAISKRNCENPSTECWEKKKKNEWQFPTSQQLRLHFLR